MRARWARAAPRYAVNRSPRRLLGGSAAFAALTIRTGASESPEQHSTESKLWAEETVMYKRKETSGVPLSAPGTGTMEVSDFKLAACKTLGKQANQVSAGSAAFGRTAATEPRQGHFDHICCPSRQLSQL